MVPNAKGHIVYTYLYSFDRKLFKNEGYVNLERAPTKSSEIVPTFRILTYRMVKRGKWATSTSADKKTGGINLIV